MFSDVGSDEVVIETFFHTFYEGVKHSIVAQIHHFEHVFEKADFTIHFVCYGLLQYGFHEAYLLLALVSFIGLLLALKGAI